MLLARDAQGTRLPHDDSLLGCSFFFFVPFSLPLFLFHLSVHSLHEDVNFSFAFVFWFPPMHAFAHIPSDSLLTTLHLSVFICLLVLSLFLSLFFLPLSLLFGAFAFPLPILLSWTASHVSRDAAWLT